MSRRPRHSNSHAHYSNSPRQDQMQWNTQSPARLIQSMPLMSSYAPNYDDGFIRHLNIIKKMVTWLENESDIFDKSLLSESTFQAMKSEIDNVNNCILNGLKDCNDLIENNLITYNNYSKFKAKTKHCKAQYDIIHKILNRSIHKMQRGFTQKNAKRALLENTKTSYNQQDEHQHLTSAHNIIDDTLAMLKDVKMEMFEQSNLLKKAKTSLLKFINLTGFSGSIIRVISQRSTMDFYIFIAGCIITLTVIFALVWFF